MFNLQGGELMIILLLALVVLGPEKLPEAMRKLGKMYGEMKRMSTGFQEEFRSAVDEPMREFRKAVDEPMNEIRGTASALRDSADFRRFEAGERTEKPKSGDMAAITDSAAMLHPADPEAVPTNATPTFEPADRSDPDPEPFQSEPFPRDPGQPDPGQPDPGQEPLEPELFQRDPGQPEHALAEPVELTSVASEDHNDTATDGAHDGAAPEKSGESE